MSRYSARLRAIEAKLRPGECPECRDQPWEYITVDEDHPEPGPTLCDTCGQPRRRFITVMYVDGLEDEGRAVMTAQNFPG